LKFIKKSTSLLLYEGRGGLVPKLWVIASIIAGIKIRTVVGIVLGLFRQKLDKFRIVGYFKILPIGIFSFD
jgi:hypothetical protein